LVIKEGNQSTGLSYFAKFFGRHHHLEDTVAEDMRVDSHLLNCWNSNFEFTTPGFLKKKAWNPPSSGKKILIKPKKIDHLSYFLIPFSVSTRQPLLPDPL
jgi:hypothetical protein